jgi:hypothetical protein
MPSWNFEQQNECFSKKGVKYGVDPDCYRLAFCGCLGACNGTYNIGVRAVTAKAMGREFGVPQGKQCVKQVLAAKHH